MQTQKDEVRNKILDAAIEEFILHGYEKASMRNIAAQAGITAGNIYSYFKGKEKIFETIVLPTVMQIKGLIFIKLSTDNVITQKSAEEVTNQMAETFLSNPRRFLILMNSADGSPYANIKILIQTQIKERLIADLIPQLHIGKENEILADTLSLVLLDGIINIVTKSGADKLLMNRLICDFLLLVFGNVSQRL